MYTGYLQLGNVEIANTDRLYGYLHTADCVIPSFNQQPCGTLQEALGDVAYEVPMISEAPWFDPTNPEVSSRFFGVHAYDITGIHDSTRQVQVTQAIREGGILGAARHETKSIKVKALLVAKGQDALDYGLNWLNSALEPGACGQHGSSCGVADLLFFTTCPPPMVYMEDPEDPDREIPDMAAYDPLIRPFERYMHDVAAMAPTVREYLGSRQEIDGVKAADIEFTITSERGYVYSRAVPVPLLTVADAYEDVQKNLFLNPTADYPGPAQVLRRNLVPNPSLETNVTGWAIAGRQGSGGTVAVTGGRVSGELRAAGSWSEKAIMPAVTGDIGEALITWEQTIPASSRHVSLGIWGAVSDPSSVVNRLRAEYRIGTGAWLPLAEAPDVGAAKAGHFYKSATPLALPATPTASVGIRFIATGTAGFSAYADAAMAIEG